MIVYLDSSVLARAYLADEDGHDEAVELLANTELALVTGTWTRIEVSGALVRAARVGRGLGVKLLALLDEDLSSRGPVTTLSADQSQIEELALELVREYALRAMDAWHIALASLTMPRLAEPGEALGFASRDAEQARVAELRGLAPA